MISATFLLLAGCRFGQVKQGRVVEYDAAKGLVTLVADSTAVTVRIPQDPEEMGPAPAPGRLLRIDSAGRRLITYGLPPIPYTPVEEHTNVGPGDRPFPLIDRGRKTITVYDPAARMLVTVTVADEHLGLPPETFRAGDEVRYYYKEPGQALRMMNVSKTDIRTGK